MDNVVRLCSLMKYGDRMVFLNRQSWPASRGNTDAYGQRVAEVLRSGVLVETFSKPAVGQ